jgi:DNA mismatch endonuclease (patch repair protein)
VDKALRKRLAGGTFKRVSPERSRTMSAIRGAGNKTTEVRFRLALVRAGIKGWRVRPRGLPNSPDFCFPRRKLAVFVDGCFWHGCPKCGHIPKTRTEYWRAKFKRNRQRDIQAARKLRAKGFDVLRYWEHELVESAQDCVKRLLKSPRPKVVRSRD